MAESGGGGEEFVFEPTVFCDAVTRLYSRWEAHGAEEGWGSNADAIAIVSGASQEDVITFPKSLALHAALFQLELSDVLLVFTAKDIYMLAASKKAKIAQALSEKLPESFGRKLVVMTRDKTDKDAANFGKILDEIKASKEGKKLASLPKEKLAGAFAEGWEKALKDSGLDIVDVQNGISDFLSIKSAQQIDAVRKGSALGSEAFKKEIINKILDVVDEENTKFSMLKMTEQIEDKIPKLAKDQKLDDSEVEVVLPPVVQSASGGYDLKYSAQVQDKALALPDQGVPAIHVASITLRHKLVSCTVARTLLFNSKKEQADNYKTLFQMFDECLAVIKPGVQLNKVYEEATKHLQANKPELIGHLHKELGWGIGYEIREKRLVLDEKNKHKFHAGQVFCLRLGLENLECKGVKGGSQKYALVIADTLLVTETGTEVLTSVNKKHSKVSWNVSDEAEEEKKTEKKSVSKEEVSKTLKEKFGTDKTRMIVEDEGDKHKQFEEKNKELAAMRVEEQRRRVNKELGNGRDGRALTQVSGYNGPEDYPNGASGTQLAIDDRASTVLVPVNGMPTPFHISTIKNVNVQQQGTAGSVLRINFVSPGFGINANVANKSLMYLRELSFRTQDSKNIQLLHKQINDMKKQFTASEKEKKARDELVPQEALRLNNQPNRPRLQTLKIYPSVQKKKTEGDLEAHINGFRFTVRKAPSADLKHVDILYRNIKHAFFQPSNASSSLILLHFRLKNPIMIGKTSTKDIQFFVEHMEDGESLLDNKRKNMHDKDELEDENRHKQMVFKLDSEFKKFCDKVTDILPAEDASDPDGDKIWDWDIPYFDLEFRGNPKNSMVELYPTVNCIVHLATKPVCIIELDNVDLAYYERVRGGISNFDLTFVLKSFLDAEAKIADCWQRITAIEMKYKDSVREVLQKSKLVQFEGANQVNWTNVLKDYVKNFEDISKDGGWKAVFGEDEEEEDDDDEEEDEDFDVVSGSGSDYSDEASSDDVSSGVSENDDDYSDEELSDEGLDSDEAEAWAEEEDERDRRERKEKEMKKGGLGGSDNKRGRGYDSGDDRPKKKQLGKKK